MAKTIFSICQSLRRLLVGAALNVALASSVFACEQERPVESYRFIVRVEADPGQPVAGAKIFRENNVVGTSDETGLVTIEALASEGTKLRVRVECPENYASPEPFFVISRHMATGLPSQRRLPEHAAHCTPKKRRVVVAIRASNAPNLPILHLGRRVGSTDQFGAAHVLLEAAPSDLIHLVLDTSSNPRLKPQNPTASFEVTNQDQVLVFNQDFAEDKPKPKPKPKPPRQPEGPIKLLAPQ